MALAKFLEDISDRFLESQEAMGRLEATFAPGTYLPAPTPQSGWVRLALNSRPLPDRIALVKGDAVSFRIVRDNPEAPFAVTFVGGPSQELPKISVVDQDVSFEVSEDGLYALRVSCGSYSREYEIDVTGTLDLDQQEPIQQGYLYLQDRPDEWTRERLDTLRRMMVPANRPAGIPDSFCNGVLDYHLALFHAEEDSIKVANQRFEDAYKNLRPFILHSDVARFICDYIRYLMNQFEGCDPSRNLGSLGGLRSFFKADNYEEALTPADAAVREAKGRYFEVLVKSIDRELLDVVVRLRGQGSQQCEASLEALESRLQVLDRRDLPCRSRIQLVLARGFRRVGRSEDASRLYRQLSQAEGSSGPWHRESNNFLSSYQ